MPVKFGSKDYKTVAERLSVFFSEYKGHRIHTYVESLDDVRVVMRAAIVDENGSIVATGHASVDRGSNSFTSKDTEKCETTAVGRALAFLSEELMGSDIASADEVAASINEGDLKDLIKHNGLVREFWPSITAVKDYLEPKWGEHENQHHVTEARAVLKELGDDVSSELWRAPTKGGCFTTKERELLKTPPEDAL